MVWIKKHAVNKISVIVDMREFKVVGSGSQAMTNLKLGSHVHVRIESYNINARCYLVGNSVP